mgnify:CR=1 FL=1
MVRAFALACSLGLLAALCTAEGHHIEFDLRMPSGVEVTDTDAYVCVAAQLPPKPHKLIGVLPKAKQEVVHHILLFGKHGRGTPKLHEHRGRSVGDSTPTPLTHATATHKRQHYPDARAGSGFTLSAPAWATFCRLR